MLQIWVFRKVENIKFLLNLNIVNESKSYKLELFEELIIMNIVMEDWLVADQCRFEERTWQFLNYTYEFPNNHLNSCDFKVQCKSKKLGTHLVAGWLFSWWSYHLGVECEYSFVRLTCYRVVVKSLQLLRKEPSNFWTILAIYRIII